MTLKLSDSQRQLVAITRRSVQHHNDNMGWDVEGDSHALGMLLVDLMRLAQVDGLNFEEELHRAQETYEDVYASDL